MDGKIKTINECRLCGNKDIPIIWDFGYSPLANKFKNKEDLDKPEFEAPLRYFKCSNCHSVQLKDELSSEILFKDYNYESPPNLIPHFKELAKTTTDFLGIKKEDRILDIGSNNGLLLQEFKNLGYKKCVGFEPCDKIAQKARDKGIGTFSQFFNPLTAEEFVLQYKNPDLITCTNCFAHVSNLNEFVEAVTIIMGQNSYFVFENAYLLNTIKNLDFGQAYFEHFYMHSVTPLIKLFEKHNLELFQIEYNSVQMGSIRGYVRKKENQLIKKDDSVIRAEINEISRGLHDLDIYDDFINNVNEKKENLLDKLQVLKYQDKTISVFGWPAKMTLLNKYFGLEKYVDYIIEESDVKIGKFAPGTKLGIYPVSRFRNFPTDCCLIGAYNFEKDIKNKNQWYLGEWINPLKI